MRASTFKAFAATAILSTFGIALVHANGPDPALKDVAGYRQWTRVTRQPIPVDSASLGG